MKQCLICGKPFEPRSPRQLMCSAACQRERNRQRCKKYYDAHGYEPDKRREYFRLKRKQYRTTEKKPKCNDFVADGYAERQKQKTFASVGKVRVTL